MREPTDQHTDQLTDQPTRAADLAARLGLGEALPGSLCDLKPGDPNPVWALDTATGRWLVKTARPAGPWWHDGAHRSAVLERAAAEAGISVPRIVEPLSGAEAVGLWTRVDDRYYLRAMERIEGENPGPDPIGIPVARWVGSTLAALEAVAPEVEGPWSVTGYETHPIAEWEQWLGEAHTLGLLSESERRAALALVSVLNSEIESSVSGTDGSGEAVAPELRLLHRDVSRFNILLSPNGPVLIDFDHAGPQHPWWEAVAHIFSLASSQNGPGEPDRAVIDAALDAYRVAGGVGESKTAGAGTAAAFTGMLAARLSFAAWLLWNACGHRGGDEAWQRKCGTDFRTGVAALRSLHEAAATWATWLS